MGTVCEQEAVKAGWQGAAEQGREGAKWKEGVLGEVQQAQECQGRQVGYK